MGADKTSDENEGETVGDDELMTSIASGDKQAFNIYLSRHLSHVTRFASRYLIRWADAEDVAQETFIRVWQKAASWVDRGISPRSWMYRITYNLCIDQIRQPHYSVKEFDDYVQQTDLMTPETQMIENLEIKQLETALMGLPERQRTAVTLCAYRGLSNQEAADVLDVSIEALESLLSRGRRKLWADLKTIKESVSNE